MAIYNIILPELGEGVIEATLTQWLVKVGDTITEDQSIAEIATDKVDSDVPSPRNGVVKQLLYQVNQVMPVGSPIAILEIEGEETAETITQNFVSETEYISEEKIEQELMQPIEKHQEIVNSEDRFYSPLIKNIAKEEKISQQELDTIKGSGINNRLTKDDLFEYLKNRNKQPEATKIVVTDDGHVAPLVVSPAIPSIAEINFTTGQDEIIEMTRMRKIIATHMVESKRISPHVTSFVEADMTRVVQFRNKIKDRFLKERGENFTFTPIFVHAIAKALKDFPLVNVQVGDDFNIIVKKNINIGMAVATNEGNLIVPVIKNADQYNLSGLATVINDLAKRARVNQLKPDEVKDGTYTLTNIGSFGNLFGTPIINQPQSAILAVGSIQKKPAVIETPEGDVIAVRHKMYLSHSFDHRVIDGYMGGMFVKRVADYLENFEETL